MAARPEITFGQFLPVLSGTIATESNVATRIDILWNAADGGRGEGGAGGKPKFLPHLSLAPGIFSRMGCMQWPPIPAASCVTLAGRGSRTLTGRPAPIQAAACVC